MTPPQTALDVLIVGYPLDKGLNSLWSAHGQAHMQSSNIGGENVASSATWATHDVDTKQGNSGALCLVKIEGAGDVNGAMEYAAVAVHNGYMKVTGLNYASVVTVGRLTGGVRLESCY